MRYAVLIATTCLIAPMAVAQNYVPAQNYNGPNVAVNLDVLSGGGTPVVHSVPLPPPTPMEPIILRPPQPRAVDIPPAMPPARELLAHARDKAAADEGAPPVTTASQQREQIIFDEPVAAAPVDLLEKPVAPVAEKDAFEAYRLFFEDKSDTLSTKEQAVLDNVVRKVKENDALRVQIQAFASATPETMADARRLSLMRALAVRGAMIKSGIKADRINVRAMGADPMMTDTKQPPNRVDIIFVK
jgi:outer membrane protein OmpA-like peptidoglycan-associated protein